VAAGDNGDVGGRAQNRAHVRLSVGIADMLAFMGLGTMELVIVAGVILLLFGSRLPKVMRSLGEGIVEFKRGIQSSDEEPKIGQPGE
jgi:sec-independent protein translocase protein TatA